MTTRIVVKIGSSSLTGPEGGLNREAVSFFASEIAELKKNGCEVLLVTSGAVAMRLPQYRLSSTSEAAA